MTKSLLVCAPHTDDAELGCGGTIARLSEEGWTVHVAAFSNAEQSLPAGSEKDRLEREMRQALSVLSVQPNNIYQFHFPVRRFQEHRQSILDTMITLGRDIKPDFVMIPASQDVHQDHGVIHQEGLRAYRGSSIWGYELPWNQITTDTHGFVPLERRHIDLKIKALMCYKSQVELNRPYFSEEVLAGLAAIRGVQIKRAYAEAYQILRSIV